MTLVVYPGADGSSILYEDDGKTFAYREGKRMWIEMGWRNAERRLTLCMARGSRLLPPVPRTFEVRVAGEKMKKTVVFDGSVSVIQV
jgi:alpha-glucosidase (family GH31 glycosyl hydrolase)